MLEQALWYASRGMAVFPLYGILGGQCTCGRRDCRNPGKHPRTKNGLKDATCDPSQIRLWWKMWPHSNIGIATGAASGVVVLDVDNHGISGSDTLSEWESEQGELPETWMVLTGGGGIHYFFAKPPALTIKNRAGVLPGLDIRGDGGYVVAPPSVHASGHTYTWEVNHDPTSADVPLAPLPDALCRLAIGSQDMRPPFELPNTVSKGSRNDTMFRLAASLRAKGLSETAILAAVRAENSRVCVPPLPDAELTLIASSASRYPAGQLASPEPPEPINFSSLTLEELVAPQTFSYISSISDRFQRTQAITQAETRARQLRALKVFQRNYRAWKSSQASQRTGNTTDFSNQPVTLNCGEWLATDAGVIKKELTHDGDIIDRIASPIPILPTELLYNVDDETEKLRLEFFKDGRWKWFICDRKTAASQQKIIDLADRGVEVNSENAKLLVKYIADCVALNLDVLPRYRSISRLGWVEGGFMPYDKEIRFDGEKENKPLFDNFTQKGSFEEWVEFVSPLRKNILLRLQMAASFASPLIELVNALPFVFHLWGGTGAGKTVGMMVAMSIWGDPRLGKLTRTIDLTHNSLRTTLGFLYNLPYAGDELQTIKSQWNGYDQLIMRICEGIDRGRMTYDRNNALKTWKLCCLLTGEEPCTKSSSGGGVKNRVIEIECDQKVVEDGPTVAGFIADHYGWAGLQYIKSVAAYKNLSEEYLALMDNILLKCDTTEKQAMAAALMLLGDKIAVETIFTDERPLEIEDISPFLTSAADVDVAGRAYDHVMSLVSQNIRKFKDNEYDESWGKIREDQLIFNKSVLCAHLDAAGFSFDAVKRAWADRGWIKRFGRAYTAKLLTINGTAQTYAVVFTVPKTYADDVPWEV